MYYIMKTKHIIFICILCTIIGAIGYRSLFKCTENEIIRTDTVYVSTVSFDTIIQIKPMPTYITQVQYSIDTLYHDVDTAFILRDYFATRFYDDTLKDDSEGYVRITESVTQNTLFDRMLYFESRCTDMVVTNTISNTGFYALGGLGWSQRAPIVSVGVMYQNKRQRLYGLNLTYLDRPVLLFQYGIKFWVFSVFIVSSVRVCTFCTYPFFM